MEALKNTRKEKANVRISEVTRYSISKRPELISVKTKREELEVMREL